ncbi:MAG TPA: crotonyl-CoA carboxylase/reductase [Candidatus Acidoferrales bacterium]|nr:crotonyl-CoA carboxylase/reductase [Candidatus Acidoferrales bacterium]
MSTKEIYEIGEVPPVGHVPAQMYAQLIRAERFGEPKQAFKVEKVAVPDIKPDEALVYVMAAGVNFNNVWAALGSPVNVIAARQKANYDQSDFHIGGSDASGIVYAAGRDVKNIKVGDHVVIHCGVWERDCPAVKAGEDPMFDPSFKIWGYETNWGSFAQFTKAQAHQCMPKAQHLTWEEAAAPTLVGATAYRMLMAWPPHTVRKNDVVLIWGASGGLGSMAIQIVKAQGGVPVGVVGDDRKIDFCMKLGAKGCINRKRFSHWGVMPHWKDNEAYNKWAAGCRAFGKAIWDIVGERRSPRLVFEHPGEDTVPTSIFVCDSGGMVVICAGTTGYNAVVDLRYLWMRQKRFQGSHFANDDQAYAFNQLVLDGKIDPCLARTFSFDEIPLCHQLMHENKAPEGKMVALVGAPKTGMK